MPCYHPIPGYFAKRVNESGKRSVVFNLEEGFKDKQIAVPCGKCVGCRLQRSRHWAMRCMHESKLFDRNCFITLTYDEDNVPEHDSLRPRDFQLFMKKLRKKFGAGIRFFQCGEYGGDTQRPHHHALLFNHDFDDKVYYKNSTGSDKLYTSKVLDDLWGFGFGTVGSCNYESAGYVARYSLKKVFGPAAAAHYGYRVPEYLTMSRRPGIGKDWALKYLPDYYPSDEVVVNGHKNKPPRYYDEIMEKLDAEVMREIKRKRTEAAMCDEDNSPERLIVREEVHIAAVLNGVTDTFKVVKPGPYPTIGSHCDSEDVFDPGY